MKTLLKKLYLYRIFSEFIVLYPLYTVMFAERGELNTLQISTMLGVWSVIILVCEIPSGALADKYSRKRLLGVAQVIRAAGYVLWVFWPTFEGFLIGLGLWGIGRSLTSGTFEALVYDELKAEKQEKTFAKVIGRTESLALFFGIGSTLAAAPILAWLGYSGVLWFSVAATLVSAAVAFTLPERKKQESVEAPAYKDIFIQAVRETKRNRALLKLIVFGVFVGMLFRIFDEYASLIIKAAEVPTVIIPLVSVAIFLPVIIADFFAYHFEKFRQETFMLILIAAGIALVLAGKWLGPAGLLAFAVFMLCIKLSITVFGAKMQHAMTGRTRATVTSINSFGVEIAAVAAFFVYGILSQSNGIASTLMVFGATTSLVGVLYLVATKGRLFRKNLSSKFPISYPNDL